MKHTDEIVTLAKKFIAVPSETTNRDACLVVLETAQKELREYTFTPFVKDGIPSLLYTNTDQPTKQCKIILNAHLDVVPGEHAQFTPIEKDGRLYGRGAYDMKAAAAVLLLVFKELAPQLPYTLGLQLTTDEEIVGYKGVGYQIEQGVTTEFVISGECGSSMKIVNQLKGLYVIKLNASGIAAHAAYPWTGENALLILYTAIDTILKHYPLPEKPSWTTTVNLAHIQTSNITHNKVPHDASALLDIRFIQEDMQRVLPKIKSLLPVGVTMEIIKTMPSHLTEKTNPYVQQLLQACHEVTGEFAEVSPSYAGSDIIFFSMKNMHSVEFGPKGGGQHSEQEWVDIKSLTDYYETLKNFLLSVT